MCDGGEISRLIEQLGERPPGARAQVLAKLVPLVYGELKTLARYRRASWRGPTDPGTTSLVHEAYARLAQHDPTYAEPRQFFSVASKAMRSILVDNARWHQRQKRGGKQSDLSLEGVVLVSEARSEELLALDLALHDLEKEQAELALIVDLRCFGGLTIEETAETLELSPATVKRRWSLARAWLHRRLAATPPGSPTP